MADPSTSPARRDLDFKERLLAGDPLLGTFLKTAAPQMVEILGSVGFDFIVIDQEHAPLGPEAVDLLLLAAKARRLPAFVRVSHPGGIGHALDCGADGIVAPHVTSAEEARDVVAACRYVNGRRGYSNSPRAGDYGHAMLAEHVRAQDVAMTVVIMIEEATGVAQVEEILAVDGVDATFIGCADLAVSLGESSADTPKVRRAVQKVTQAAIGAGRRALAPAPSMSAATWLLDLGINALVISSDQGLLRAGATAARHDFAMHRMPMTDSVR